MKSLLPIVVGTLAGMTAGLFTTNMLLIAATAFIVSFVLSVLSPRNAA